MQDRYPFVSLLNSRCRLWQEIDFFSARRSSSFNGRAFRPLQTSSAADARKDRQNLWGLEIIEATKDGVIEGGNG
jgi:hypothetical protein